MLADTIKVSASTPLTALDNAAANRTAVPEPVLCYQAGPSIQVVSLIRGTVSVCRTVKASAFVERIGIAFAINATQGHGHSFEGRCTNNFAPLAAADRGHEG